MKPGTPGFVGERLREAREARTLTAIALAELVGVSRAAISQYERGHQSPSPAAMRKLSECLNLPIQFFLRQPVRKERGTIFYRSMSAATKKARLRAEWRYEWLREIADFLRNYVHFPEVNFPKFDVPLDPVKIDEELIEELAYETRIFWGLSTGPISNVSWLLENQGVVVSRCELGARALDAFSEWREDSGSPYVILGAGKASAVRSRFDAAHELAHLILHRHLPKSTLNQSDTFRLVEQQADHFAGAFLLPAVSFTDDFFAPSLDGMRTLKGKWRVSIAAMIKRSSQLGLISEARESSLWINLGRRKWRTKEPLDDVLEVEEPRFLKRTIELLVKKGVIAPNELSMHFALATHDIEQLAGLDEGFLCSADREIILKSDETANNATAPEEATIIPFPKSS